MNILAPKKLAVIFLLLATVTVFLPSLKNGFTNWDDEELLTDNQLVRDISWQNTKKIFGAFTVSTYVPLTVLSYSVEYRLWGLNPKGYHAVNLALHAANAALLFFLLLSLGLPAGPALAGALFWAIHPLRAESVAWATGRKDVLYAFFFLGSLLAYLSYLKNERWSWYLTALLLFVLSCLSKGLAVVLPPALLLTDHLVNSKIDKKAWLNKIPFFAAAVIFGMAGLAAQRSAGLDLNQADHQWWNRIGAASYNLIFYLGKTIFPVRLSALYPYPGNGEFPWPWVFWAAPALALALVVMVLIMIRKSARNKWGWGFFLIAVLPVLQLIKLQGAAMAADRYLYLPAIGLSVMAAEGWLWLKQNITDKTLLGTILIFTGAAALAGLGAEATYQRTKVWESSLALWNDVIVKHPQAAVAYNNRGKYFASQGQPDRALNDFSHALSLQPDYVTALGNRALAFLQSGDYVRAIDDLDRAIAINPLDTRNINNRGALAVKQGDFQQALSYLNTALEINPKYSDAYYNRGLLFFAIKDYDRSLKDLTEAIRIEPYYTKAYLKRARLYLDLARPESAIKDAEQAVSLDPASAAAYNILGLAYGIKGEYARSLSELNRALEVDPDFAETYNNLAMLYYARQEYDKSWAYLQKAQELGYKPDVNLIKDVKGKLK